MDMKKLLSILAVGVLFAACAGNPPAWWNPGNRYGKAEQTDNATSAKPAKRMDPVVKEIAIDPLPDNSYEEEVIAPLPEEEDMPADTPVTEPALDDVLPAPSILE